MIEANAPLINVSLWALLKRDGIDKFEDERKFCALVVNDKSKHYVYFFVEACDSNLDYKQYLISQYGAKSIRVL